MNGDTPIGSDPPAAGQKPEAGNTLVREPPSAQSVGAHASVTAGMIDPRDVELLTINVAEKALERIVKSLRWPLLLAAALATYTGYNLIADAKNRIDTFKKDADERLAEIDKKVNEILDKKLEKALADRRTALTEITIQLQKESAAAVVEAERARAASKESSKEIERQKDTIAQVRDQAEKTIAALEEQLREVSARKEVVMLAFANVTKDVGQRNLQIIKNDPQTPGGLLNQQALTLIRVKAAIEEIGEAKPVKVAVLGTGIEKFNATPNGETLEGRLIEGKSFVSGEAIKDKNGHGTSIASLVAVIAPKARIISLKVLSDTGAGTDAVILGGLAHAMSVDARIVILPIGSPGPPAAAYAAAFEAMRKKGILVFVAAGNGSNRAMGLVDPVSRPANSPNAIAVTATTLDDRLSNFASGGPEIALSAPGQDVLTVTPGGTYKSYSGSSYSAAIAAGVAALVLSARPDLTAEEVESILKQSAKRLGLRADEGGAGRVDALAAVRLAKTYVRRP